MNSNTLSKVDIYNFLYTEGSSEFDYTTGKSAIDDKERFITNVKINNEQEGYRDFLSYCLNNSKSVDSRTICIDYRLLNDETIEELEKSYKNGNILGMRLVPDDTPLTTEILRKFDRREFSGFLISANNIEDYNSQYLDIRSQHNICKIEKIRFKENEEVEDKIHITRKLSDEEIHTLSNLIKENNYNEILVDFYEPMYYRAFLEALRKENISTNINIRLLANPLYDEASIYEGLDDILDNQIIVRYNTCKDLNDYYREEPYSSGAIYLSDIEASGVTSVDNYESMIEMFDEVMDLLEQREYSPLEKVAYIHDYFKKNYQYNHDYSNDKDEKNNRDLDRVYDKDKMICEGFSNLYSALLRRAGILCFTYGTDNHQKNIIRIKDDKYGVDNIAIIDPTWDLDNFNNRNIFKHFLVPIDNDLYAVDPEVINVPIALSINNGTYSSYIKDSNPVYATDAIDYAIRMLQLMGLGREDEHEFVTEDDINFYKSALANSKLIERIPTDKIVEAVHHVRRTEHDYSEDFEENYDYEQIQENVESRGNPHDITPRIRLFDNTEIPTRYYVPNKEIKFVEKDNQYVKYHRPRKKKEEESQEEYERYLKEFYHETFYNDIQVNETKQEEKITNAPIDEVHQPVIPSTKEENIEDKSTGQVQQINVPNIQEELSQSNQSTNILETITIYRDNDRLFATTDTFNRFQIKLSNLSYKMDNVNIYELNDMISCLLLNYNFKENLPFKIVFSNIKIDSLERNNTIHPEYEVINNNKSEIIEDEDLIPGTNFKKPRGRGIYETDEEYVEYLEYYYNSIFPPEENDVEEYEIVEENTPRPKNENETDEEYTRYLEEFYGVIPEEDLIPGTNFRKPRGRGIYETDEEYVAFLEEYYTSIFGEEVVENSKKGKVR